MVKSEVKAKHSITIYLPRKHNSFLTTAIKVRAIEKFGIPESFGRASKYVMDLVYKDLQERGLLTDKLQPNELLLQEIVDKTNLLP